MRPRLRFFLLLAALVAGTGALLTWQRRETARLRGEIAVERDREAEQRRLAAENQRLTAAQSTGAELDALAAERAAVALLREQLDALRRRARETARLQAAPAPEPEPPSLAGHVLAYSLWRNRGRTTPAAALETALWSAANGEVDALTDLLLFEPAARTEATALFAQLPENLRQEFVSPERLVAVLAAKDVPLGRATLLNQYPTPTETKLSIQVFDTEGKQKLALLSLRPDDAGWRFVVPVNAVRRYAAWLHAPAAAKTAD